MTEKNLEKEKAEEKDNLLADIFLARHYLEVVSFDLKQEDCSVFNAAIDKLNKEAANMMFDNFIFNKTFETPAIDYFKQQYN